MFETDRQGAAAPESAAPAADAAPEHFQLWAAVQKEFYQHDIYARVCIFYGFIHYVQSLAYYGLGHINIELRAFWVAYGTAFVIAVLMALMLRFDIIPANPDKKQYLPRCEYCGPLAILPAAIGMSLDFQVEFSTTAIAVTWLMIFVSYFLQLIYALRMLEVVLPDESFAGLQERLGGSYLPEGWRKVPSSFYHVLYFVAPPEKLQPGQHDIVREVKAGGAGAYGEVTGEEKGAGSDLTEQAVPQFASDKFVEPWKLVTGIAGVLPICWCFLIFGNIVDVALGEQALVTAPHWSRPPMTRLSKEPHELGTPLGFPWHAGAKAWLPEAMAWHEEKRHAAMFSLTRRLSEKGVATPPTAPPGGQLSADKLHSALQGLLSSIPAAAKVAAAPVLTADEHIEWPGFFEPQVLACGPGGAIAAVAPRGFGATAMLGHGQAATAEAFRFTGLTQPVIAASWGHRDVSDGMLLVSRDGNLLACPRARPRAGAVWHCGAPTNLPRALPVFNGIHLTAASVALLPGLAGAGGELRLHAALTHESEPELVALFAHEAGSWVPLGEVRVPRGGSKISLAFIGMGDLLISTSSGHMMRCRLADGSVISSAEHAVSSQAHWQGACGLHREDVSQIAHLRLRSGRPEIMTAEIPHQESRPAFFQ